MDENLILQCTADYPIPAVVIQDRSYIHQWKSSSPFYAIMNTSQYLRYSSKSCFDNTERFDPAQIRPSNTGEVGDCPGEHHVSRSLNSGTAVTTISFVPTTRQTAHHLSAPHISQRFVGSIYPILGIEGLSLAEHICLSHD